MRILHVSHLYFPSNGGIELNVKLLSERLVKAGHEVTVFTSNAPCVEALWNPEIPLLPSGSECLNGVKVRRFSPNRIARKTLRILNFPLSLMQIPVAQSIDSFTQHPFIPGMVAEILRFKPDILLATPFSFINSVVYYAYLAKRLGKIPLIYHTALHLEHRESFPPITYRMLNFADGVWCNTDYEKEFLVTKGIADKKIYVIGVGVDPSAFDEADGLLIRKKYALGDSPVVLFVGRKDEEKGVMTAVDAMLSVWKHFPEAKLILAGTPTTFSKTILKAKTSALKSNILVEIDDFSEADKKHIYAACDIFVMPSRVESFGITFLEAWACKKPVIGADIGAVRCVIKDGEDGFLVQYGNSDQLSRIIIRLLKNPDLRDRIGRSGWQKVQQDYTWDMVTQKVMEVYRGLCLSG